MALTRVFQALAVSGPRQSGACVSNEGGVPQMGGNLLGKAELDGSGGLCGSCPLNYLGQKGLPEEGA